MGDGRGPLYKGIVNRIMRHSRGFVGVVRLHAIGAHGSDNVIVPGAVHHIDIGVGEGRGVGDQGIAAAGERAAVEVIAGGVCRGIPSQVDLRNAFDGKQVEGCGGRVKAAAGEHQHGAEHGGYIQCWAEAAIYLDGVGVGGDGSEYVGEHGAGGQVAAQIVGESVGSGVAVEDDDGGIGIGGRSGVNQLAPVGVDQVGVVHQQGVKGAGAQGGVVVAGGGEQDVVIADGILPGLGSEVVVEGFVADQVQPGEGLAVVGVVFPFAAGVDGGTHQADFIPIVNGGGAGQGELQDGGAAQAHDGVAPVVIGLEVDTGVILSGAAVEHEEGAVGIVAVEQVQHGVQGFSGVALLKVKQALVELRGGELVDGAGAAASVVIIIGKGALAPETEHGGAELVVHDGIPLVADEPGGAVAPFFAHDVAFGVGAMDGGAELVPIQVGGIVGGAGVNVGAHVQAPAISAGVVFIFPYPIHGDGIARAGIDQGAYGGFGRIELGQAVVPPPALVIGTVGDARAADAGTRARGDIGEVIPVAVGAGVAFAGAIRGIAMVTVEVEAVGRCVVEDAIQDDPDPTVIGSLNEAFEQGQVAEVVVDDAVIRSIVLVVGGRFEDGVEVDGGNAQLFDVIQLIQDALQVAAVEVLAVGARARAGGIAGIADRLVPVGLVRAEDGVWLIIKGCAGWGVVVEIAIAEAVGEDLVEDGVLDPIGGGVAVFVNGELPGIIGAFIKGLPPAAGAAAVIFVIVGIAAIDGDEAVPVDGGIGAGGQSHFPPVVLGVG